MELDPTDKKKSQDESQILSDRPYQNFEQLITDVTNKLDIPEQKDELLRLTSELDLSQATPELLKQIKELVDTDNKLKSFEDNYISKRKDKKLLTNFDILKKNLGKMDVLLLINALKKMLIDGTEVDDVLNQFIGVLNKKVMKVNEILDDTESVKEDETKTVIKDLIQSNDGENPQDDIDPLDEFKKKERTQASILDQVSNEQQIGGNDVSYLEKYIKYKNKYLKLKKNYNL